MPDEFPDSVPFPESDEFPDSDQFPQLTEYDDSFDAGFDADLHETAGEVFSNVGYEGKGLEVPLAGIPEFTHWFISMVNSAYDQGGANDSISAVKVNPGFKITLWEHFNYEGRSITLTEDTPDLRKLGFNDKASSYRAERI